MRGGSLHKSGYATSASSGVLPAQHSAVPHSKMRSGVRVHMRPGCRQETFSQMFLGSLKRGGPKESELAARALGEAGNCC